MVSDLWLFLPRRSCQPGSLSRPAGQGLPLHLACLQSTQLLASPWSLAGWPGGQGGCLLGQGPAGSERCGAQCRARHPGAWSGLGRVIPLSGSQRCHHPTEARPCPLNCTREVQSQWLRSTSHLELLRGLVSEGGQGHHSQRLLSKVALHVDLPLAATLPTSRWEQGTL